MKNKKLFCGIDEAGRGPVIGPLVMAIVACSDDDKQFFNKLGVKDSKQLSSAKRVKLARIIRKRCAHAIVKLSPAKIDKALISKDSSLNCLEAETSRKLINMILKKVNPTAIGRVMLDLPSKNVLAYITRVRGEENFGDLNIVAEFKADENYIEVSAASILAKTVRDATMKHLEKNLNLKLGSGYPSDPNTKQSLRLNFEKLKSEGVLRMQWKTISNLLDEKTQRKLGDF